MAFSIKAMYENTTLISLSEKTMKILEWERNAHNYTLPFHKDNASFNFP